MLEEKLWTITGKTDLIILPEMFSTGFTMDVERLAEPMNLTTLKWMRQQAASFKACITGSFIVKDGVSIFNRLIWMRPDGSYEVYDKRHLFRMADEDDYFSSGEKRIIVEINGWKVCPLICYDLRFPVWSRNTVTDSCDLAYDVLLYVANWPQPRINAWDVLLQARAMENLSYCVGVNRTGLDGKGKSYSGHSAVYDPKGLAIIDLGEEENIDTVALDYGDLKEFREKFPAHRDADTFTIDY